MVSSTATQAMRVTVFSICGMMVGFFIQDAMLTRNKRHVEASVDAALERALADKEARTSVLERRVADLAARQPPAPPQQQQGRLW